MLKFIQSSYKCSHDLHIFDAPLCKELPLWKKIANIMFHLLTLGIPLILHYVISHCFNRLFLSKFLSELPNQLSYKEVQAIRKGHKCLPEVSDLGVRIMVEVQDYITNQMPGIRLNTFSNLTKENQYTCSYQAQVSSLRIDCAHKLTLALRTHRYDGNPLFHPEVLAAMDQLMRVAFTEGMLMIEDLEKRKTMMDIKLKNHEAVTHNKIPSYSELLCSDDYYFSYIVPIFPQIYNNAALNGGGLYRKGRQLPESYLNAFNTLGTKHNLWQQLFNEYRQYIFCLIDTDLIDPPSQWNWDDMFSINDHG